MSLGATGVLFSSISPRRPPERGVSDTPNINPVQNRDEQAKVKIRNETKMEVADDALQPTCSRFAGKVFPKRQVTPALSPSIMNPSHGIRHCGVYTGRNAGLNSRLARRIITPDDRRVS
jgi:hypothetical protein